ncbi:hypothetical protein [Carboxylicivirga sp. RSCT41]|uniref:hypothetical protein n=1 Tax=Carboxylicivirga agarovorans TaxID=3417570 RepID=UPI003D33ECA4
MKNLFLKTIFYTPFIVVSGLLVYRIYDHIDYIQTIESMTGRALNCYEGILLEVLLGRYVTPLIVVMSSMGFLIKKPIGWILLTAFYYFLFSFSYFRITNLNDVAASLITSLISSVFLIIVNRSSYHNRFVTNRYPRLTINLSALLLAMSYNYIHGYIELNNSIRTITEALTYIGH